jgi:lysophospholipase L1-like esterase
MDINYIRILRPLIILACLLALATSNAAAGTIIDNTDAGFSKVGSWPSSKSNTGYYGSNYQYSSQGNGSSTATWQFNIATDGNYDVEAQWSSSPNRATNAHYTLYNNGSFVANVTKNQQINGGQFNLLGSYNLTAGTLKVVLDNNASGYVIADAVQVTYAGATSNQPPDGTIQTPAGNVTITVGDFINFTGTYFDPDDDPAQGYLWEFGTGSGLADSIAEYPGPMQFNNTGVFTVKFTVTDINGAKDPTPGQVIVTVVAQGSSNSIVDNSDAGFSTVGSWPSSASATGYYGSNYQYASNGNGSSTATWSFYIDTPGMHDVKAQWAANSNRATNAHYTLYNNGSFVANVTKNQQTNGGQFNLLGSYNLTAGTLEVVLDNNASGYVIADAVQVTYTGEATGNQPPDGTIQTPAGNVTITVGDFINFTGTYFDPDGDTAQGYLWEFGSGSGLANSSVKDPGPKQFNNTGVFTVTFTVTDINAAKDPTPAQVTVTVVAQGSSNSSSTIIDNTDADFSTYGTWYSSNTTAGYYGGDYQYSRNTSGSGNATWRFFDAIPTTGSYDVEAQWTASSNRANDAHYTIYQSVGDQWQAIAIVSKNQQINGGQFNLLGSYNLSGGTALKVVLDNNASGYVIADAIRVKTTGSPPQPQLVITSPTNNPLVSSSYETINVTVSNLPAGWGVEFVLDGDPATSVFDYGTPFEHTFTSLDKAQYGVDAYLVDAGHNRQSGFSRHTDFGIGDYFIGFGDSITYADPSHDDIISDNTSNDGRNTGGGYEPILNNLLTAKSGYPQTVINAGVSGNTTSDALLRLPNVISNNPGSTHVLILLGTNDAVFYGLDSGAGLLPGQPGYAGTYKDHMQQIVSTVVASGKIPVLGKVLFVHSPYDYANPLIQQYNTVIDELVFENGITHAPPDFYTYFEGHPALYDDSLHPNGSGFISMANLWSNVFTY